MTKTCRYRYQLALRWQTSFRVKIFNCYRNMRIPTHVCGWYDDDDQPIGSVVVVPYPRTRDPNGYTTSLSLLTPRGQNNK